MGRLCKVLCPQCRHEVHGCPTAISPNVWRYSCQHCGWCQYGAKPPAESTLLETLCYVTIAVLFVLAIVHGWRLL